MKRIFALLLCLALLIACVPTPEEEFVVNKGDGTLEAMIGEATPVPSYDWVQNSLADTLGAPQTVQDRFTVQIYGGTMDVVLDAAVDVPNVAVVPVYRASLGWDALKDRTEIVRAVLGDEVQRLDTFRAALLRCEYDMQYYNAWLADLEAGKQRIEAPMTLEDEKEYVNQNLTSTWRTMEELRDRAGEPVPWDGSFDAEDGFLYLWHAPYLLLFFDRDGHRFVQFSDLTLNAYVAAGAGRAPTVADQPMIDAAKAMLAKFSDLPVEPFGIESGSHSGSMVFAFERAGIPCLPLRYDHGDDMGYTEVMGDAQFSEGFGQELISAGWEDGRIGSLIWENPLYVTGTENENVTLMPFDKILQIFKSHIRSAYFMVVDERTGEASHVCMTITGVRLSYARVNKKDSSDFYLLPVWDFLGYVDILNWSDDPAENDALNRSRRAAQWYSSFLTINAIDGSIIDRNRGY